MQVVSSKLDIKTTISICDLYCKIPFHWLNAYPQSFQNAVPISLTQGVSIINVPGGRPDTYERRHHQNLEALYKSAESYIICALFQNKILQFIDRIEHGDRFTLDKYKDVKPKRYSLQITRQRPRDGQQTRDGFILWTDDGPNELCWYIAASNFAILGGK